MTPSQGPFCQSCGMPMTKPDDFGTGADGFKVNDYCLHCYQRGQFMNPRMTMQEMIDFCTDIMAKQRIMPEPQARKLLQEMLPTLKRWRTPAAVA